MNQVILVTGGAGYIGSHTCKVLAQNSFQPVTIDNLVNGHKWAVNWGDMINGDIRDGHLLDSVFKKYQPCAVIHFAGFAYVRESIVNPGIYYENNVCGSISLLEAMRRNNCQNIIFSSSCATYGIPDTIPITENCPQKPISPYGRSKLMIEKILKDYQHAYGVNYVILRYFNAAGADPDGEIGEKHDPETHIIPLLIQTALKKRSCFEIFGTKFSTYDGTAIRDFIHVTDLAEAHLLSLQYLLDSGQSQTMNIGSGKGYSVKDIIKQICTISNAGIDFKESPANPGDPPILIANADKSYKILNWKPSRSNIEDIIQSAWKWELLLHDPTKRKM